MKGKKKSKLISMFLIVAMVLPLIAGPVKAAAYVSKDNYQANDAYCYIVDSKTGQVIQSVNNAADPMIAKELGQDGNQLPYLRIGRKVIIHNSLHLSIVQQVKSFVEIVEILMCIVMATSHQYQVDGKV